eukprot:365133-Chlamydomonas_euryale.AAC.2
MQGSSRPKQCRAAAEVACCLGRCVGACSSQNTQSGALPQRAHARLYAHAHRWTKMVRMPSAVAMAHACWPPAPPNDASTCAAASYPFICCTKASTRQHTCVNGFAAFA